MDGRRRVVRARNPFQRCRGGSGRRVRLGRRRGAWRLATQGGAQCLGRNDCGTLEAGKCADIAYFRIDDLGWTGVDVWFAHGIHFNDAEVDRVAESGSGVAHCPSSNMRLGAGMCRVSDLVRAGARVGLGVDGAASNEDSNLAFEVHQALLLARARETSPQALDARGAWRLATQGGAQCLGRDDCGTLEAGKCADIACFRIDDLAHAGSADAVAALALAPPGRAETVDEDTVARELAATSAGLRGA